MARVSASDQLTRLLALPAWVAEHPGVTVAEAAKHFGVTPAVIERDVNTLWISGLPGGMHGDLVDFDAADFEAGRLRLSEPLGLDRPVRLTRQEAISLLMALRVLADLLADDEASAPVIASTQQAVTALLSSGASTEDSDTRVDPGTVTTTGPGPAHAGRSSRTSRILAVVRSALPGLSEDARIATKGIVLRQVVGGSLDSLSVDSPSLKITSKGQSGTSVTLSDVDVDLSRISLHKPYPTDAVTASGTISWEQVTALAATSHPKLKGVTLQAQRAGTSAQDPGVIQASMSVLGLSGEAEIAPSLGADGSLILTITSTRMSGNTLGVDVGTGQDSMLSYVGLDSPQITIPAKSLPSGLRPTSAIVTNGGLRLSLAGSRVNLGQL